MKTELNPAKILVLPALALIFGLSGCQKENLATSLGGDSYPTNRFQLLNEINSKRIYCSFFDALPAGGFAIGGYHASDGFKLIRLAESKEILGETTYDNGDDQVGYFGLVSHNGNLVVGGANQVYFNSSQAFMVITDPVGKLIWSGHFGGTGMEKAYDGTETSGGGYLLTGSSDDSLLVASADPTGAQRWIRNYGPTFPSLKEPVRGSRVIETSDGNFVILGVIGSTDSGFRHQLLKIDPAGNLIWSRIYNFFIDPLNQPYIMEASDQSLMVVSTVIQDGNPGSVNNNIWLLKLTSSSNIIWSDEYGGDRDEQARFVTETPDGGFLVAGMTNSFGNGLYDLYLVKTDGDGNRIWHKTYGDKYDQSLTKAVKRPDGGLWLLGTTETGEVSDVSDFPFFLLGVNGDGTPN